ncbi:ABC transporter [Bifidobacterium actinocoloniiforme DSM 22766]|uniref:ABC transporter n=1 Tax=Bifidobacterium actinocoloniiforme DSM 22766 TaxID=1437605 RepID=A0A086Z1B5_9BIFI|nr:dipeptide/oligopeptide/nickel ABC transporter ATP-binding protein [Bifidobacterium actinocoloniiforme]AKV55472.1 peptide ABC transporter ATPase [Bifidobacterium actinocoloniiforme DSM 22766]KFI40315.1 ABC transporter [Bifidobacterium actinocoloniiforme DSM 22766]
MSQGTGHERRIVISGQGIRKTFGGRQGGSQALQEVSVSLGQGECLALVGGSGSGKSTLTRILLGLESRDAGSVSYQGQPVDGPRSSGYQALRRESGLIFQNPFASLDPRWNALRSVSEPLRIHARELGLGRAAIRSRAMQALADAGLDPGEFAGRYPADCSGGQAQRIAIARALVADPQLIVADEPMSSLDVSARLGVLEAFKTVRARRPRTAILMVSHDLGVVQHMADRIVVLHQGQVEEEGPADRVLSQPGCAYTRELIAAASAPGSSGSAS